MKERSLRSGTPVLLDSSSEEEEESLLPSIPVAVPILSPPEKSAPERGLPDSVKRKLFTVLDDKGGFDIVSNSNRLLQDICDKDPESFGSPVNFRTPRNRRRKVSNFVDKFKSLSPELKAKRRSKVFLPQPAAPPVSYSQEVLPKQEPAKQNAVKMTRSSRRTRDDDGKYQHVHLLVLLVSSAVISHGRPMAGCFLDLLLLFLDDEEEEGPVGVVHYEYSSDHDIYGPLVITEFIDEEVGGKKFVNGYAIIVPGADTRDAPSIKAVIHSSKNKVDVTLVATRHGFFNSAEAWLQNLDKVKKKFDAVKLYKTMKTLLTRIKRKKASNKHAVKVRITFPEELTNEFLNPGAPEGILTMLPIPYVFEHESKNRTTNKVTKLTTMEANLMWRVVVVDSDRDMEEDAATDDDLSGLMGDMIG